jgi:hypothetical protein
MSKASLFSFAHFNDGLEVSGNDLKYKQYIYCLFDIILIIGFYR